MALPIPPPPPRPFGSAAVRAAAGTQQAALDLVGGDAERADEALRAARELQARAEVSFFKEIWDANHAKWAVMDALSSAFYLFESCYYECIYYASGSLEARIQMFVACLDDFRVVALDLAAEAATVEARATIETLRAKAATLQARAGKSISKKNMDKIKGCRDHARACCDDLQSMIDEHGGEPADDGEGEDEGERSERATKAPEATPPAAQQASDRLAAIDDELLALLEALEARLVSGSLDDFYLLSRALLVKDEAIYDRFDRAFGEYFKGIEALPGFDAMVPEEWLELAARRHLSEADRLKLQKLSYEKIFEQLKERLAEQNPDVTGLVDALSAAMPPDMDSSTMGESTETLMNRLRQQQAEKAAEQEQRPPWSFRFPGRDKVAIVGFAQSHRDQAPFHDPSFEIWGLNNAYIFMPPRPHADGRIAERWFEIHSEDLYGWDLRRPGRHVDWLRNFPGPLYLLEAREVCHAQHRQSQLGLSFQY